MFDKSQLVNELIPPMFNYEGVSFNIVDVMGVIDMVDG